jgi:transcriptional regulator with XRE-family HTH domain
LQGSEKGATIIASWLLERRTDMNLVERIDDYCAKEGISIKEFERRCHIGNAAIHKWRVGLNKPRLETVMRICEATGTDIGAWI